jgi:hypothetical protein
VNYRYQHAVTNSDFDALIDSIRSGGRDDIPPHGTLAKVRQDLAGDRIANVSAPEDQGQPVWIARHEAEAAS